MKKVFASLVVAAALAAPAGWASVAGAKTGPDPDANGDVHSNCHTGSKFRGAGGEDRFKLHGNGEGPCVAAPVPVNPVTPAAPPAAPAAAAAPSAGAVRAPAVTPAAAPAAPVVAAPRTTG